jgi:hypothetical protein
MARLLVAKRGSSRVGVLKSKLPVTAATKITNDLGNWWSNTFGSYCDAMWLTYRYVLLTGAQTMMIPGHRQALKF